MKRGSDGFAGGGIYFADSKEATDRKAHSRGTYLQATVNLGRAKVINDRANVSYTALKAQGFDSVKIVGLASGPEYVVYNWDQVADIRYC